MNQPLLHIIIPAYGDSPFLADTLNSVIELVPNEFPVTVLDDCSPNEKLKEIVKNYLDRIKYVRNVSRLGIANNFNKALEISEGKFTLICGSDDLFTQDLSKIIEKLSSVSDLETEFAGIIFNANVINTESRVHLKLIDQAKKFLRPKIKSNLNKLEPKQFLKTIAIGDWVYFPAIVWKTENIIEFKFSELYQSAMDLRMFVELSINEKFFRISDESIIKYRRHSASASYSNFAKSKRFKEEINCHRIIFDFAQQKKFYTLKIISAMAPTVRINAIFSLFSSNINFWKKLKKVLFYLTYFR